MSDEEKQYKEWFTGEQGKAYNGTWDFAMAAWKAGRALLLQKAQSAPVNRDWSEDCDLENHGRYLNKCCNCGNQFTGYKWRVDCKVCARSTESTTSTVPVAWVNSDELDNMLDDRTATIAGVRDGYRNTPLYAAQAPLIEVKPILPSIEAIKSILVNTGYIQPENVTRMQAKALLTLFEAAPTLPASKSEEFKPDAWANFYPHPNCYWTLHDSAQIADACEEPGAQFVAVPVCLKEGIKPVPESKDASHE